MSDFNLLLFGSVVTFIGVAGAYVYIRESFTAAEEPVHLVVHSANEIEQDAPEVA